MYHSYITQSYNYIGNESIVLNVKTIIENKTSARCNNEVDNNRYSS